MHIELAWGQSGGGGGGSGGGRDSRWWECTEGTSTPLRTSRRITCRCGGGDAHRIGLGPEWRWRGWKRGWQGQQVVGVHGGDQHAPEDEQTHNMQVRGRGCT
jgi:hypothetical protein